MSSGLTAEESARAGARFERMADTDVLGTLKPSMLFEVTRALRAPRAALEDPEAARRAVRDALRSGTLVALRRRPSRPSGGPPRDGGKGAEERSPSEPERAPRPPPREKQSRTIDVTVNLVNMSRPAFGDVLPTVQKAIEAELSQVADVLRPKDVLLKVTVNIRRPLTDDEIAATGRLGADARAYSLYILDSESTSVSLLRKYAAAHGAEPPPNLEAEVKTMFRGPTTEGRTVGRGSIVSGAKIPTTFGTIAEEELNTLINMVLHELGHAISGGSRDADHGSGGVMASRVDNAQAAVKPYSRAFRQRLASDIEANRY